MFIMNQKSVSQREDLYMSDEKFVSVRGECETSV
jgi:hypothetical protein